MSAGDPKEQREPEAPAEKKEDVVLVGGPTESGDGHQVLRKREERLEYGEIRAVREGRPLHGELVRLKQREESGRLFDVEVLHKAKPEPQRTAAGPAQVATDAYRKNWDRVFAKNRPN